MSAGTAVARGRATAERNMVDACVIKRSTGKTTDPDTGVITTTYSTVYTGKCRVQQQSGISRPGTVGEALVWMSRLELQLPMAVVGVAADDVVTLTVSALDPDLVNRTFHVRDLAHKSHATARRLQIEEITS